eukprot:Nk52_evm39s1129 gene=Nk52_evmTU39s1129
MLRVLITTILLCMLAKVLISQADGLLMEKVQISDNVYSGILILGFFFLLGFMSHDNSASSTGITMNKPPHKDKRALAYLK